MSAIIRPRAAVNRTDADAHGAVRAAEMEALRLDPGAIIDFSSNINPFGPALGIEQALQRLHPERYPDPDNLQLRRQLARQLDVNLENLLIGNGAAELIWLTVLAYVEAGDPIAIVGPTFGEYRRAALLMGGRVIDYRLQADCGFVLEGDAFERLLTIQQPRLIFLCNPNNPTGNLLAAEQVLGRVDEHPATLFVIDEAYLDFAAGARSVIDVRRPNLLVLRSMTKLHALAGLRLGYAVAHADLIEALTRVQPPWSVNVAAQSAGYAALCDADFVADSLARLGAARQELVDGLRNIGLEPLPTQTNFFLLPVSDGKAFRTRLLRHGLMVRDCASFGLPAYVRIATRRPDENRALLALLEHIVNDESEAASWR